MGASDFCANFCWVIGVVGIVFLGMLAIQVQYDNPYLLAHPDMKTSLTVHLILAAFLSAIMVILLQCYISNQSKRVEELESIERMREGSYTALRE